MTSGPWPFSSDPFPVIVLVMDAGGPWTEESEGGRGHVPAPPPRRRSRVLPVVLLATSVAGLLGLFSVRLRGHEVGGARYQGRLLPHYDSHFHDGLSCPYCRPFIPPWEWTSAEWLDSWPW